MHPDAIHAREIKLAIHYAAYEGPDGKQAAMATAGILAAASSMDVTRSLAGLPLREYLCGAGHDAFHPAMPAAIY